MDNNYITKYTLIPIYDYNGWENNQEQESVVAYIVSKCSVIKEFPSQIAEERDVYKVSIPSLPEYLFVKKTNYITKDKLFASYEEAKNAKEKLTIEILIKQIEILQQDQNYEKNKKYLIKEFLEKANKYQKIENEIQVEEQYKNIKKKIKSTR